MDSNLSMYFSNDHICFVHTAFAEYHIDQTWPTAQELSAQYNPQRVEMPALVPSVIFELVADWLISETREKCKPPSSLCSHRTLLDLSYNRNEKRAPIRCILIEVWWFFWKNS